jgi:hypothetical protein
MGGVCSMEVNGVFDCVWEVYAVCGCVWEVYVVCDCVWEVYAVWGQRGVRTQDGCNSADRVLAKLNSTKLNSTQVN